MLRNINVDFFTKVRGLCYWQGEKKAVIEQAKESIKGFYEFLGDKTWFLGEKISWIDIVFLENHEFLDALTEGEYFTEYPNFKSHFDWLLALPQIKAYKNSSKYHQEYTFNWAPAAQVNFSSRH